MLELSYNSRIKISIESILLKEGDVLKKTLEVLQSQKYVLIYNRLLKHQIEFLHQLLLKAEIQKEYNKNRNHESEQEIENSLVSMGKTLTRISDAYETLNTQILKAVKAADPKVYKSLEEYFKREKIMIMDVYTKFKENVYATSAEIESVDKLYEEVIADHTTLCKRNEFVQDVNAIKNLALICQYIKDAKRSSTLPLTAEEQMTVGAEKNE